MGIGFLNLSTKVTCNHFRPDGAKMRCIVPGIVSIVRAVTYYTCKANDLEFVPEKARWVRPGQRHGQEHLPSVWKAELSSRQSE